MADVFPSIEQIEKFKVQPTEGEFHLLKFLQNFLDDTYEIYFQPFLDGDQPDIIIMRKGSGILVIEVKDWDLRYYSVDNDIWYLKSNPEVRLLSPFKQVERYKDHLYYLHIDRLFENNLREKNYFGVVHCAVYFHNATYESASSFGSPNSFTHIIVRDSLNLDFWKKLLSNTWLNKKSRYFTDDIYDNIHRYLQPPLHNREQGKEINYNSKQKSLITSRIGEQKISGVAGSGKTKVLAKRAVAAHKRTDDRVLILTYNITLRNYIRDKISEVREDFSWGNFYIIHYHYLIINEANHCGLYFESITDENIENHPLFNDIDFFLPVVDKIRKYSVVLIDEIQDYKTEWIKIIKKYFLEPNGEFVVFGDSKQNVYSRQVLSEDKMPNTTIKGNWNHLNETYRFPESILWIAKKFQEVFLSKSYPTDIDFVSSQTALPLSSESVEYIFFENNTSHQKLANQIFQIIYQKHEHPNDIAIISEEIDLLRQIDFEIRDKLTNEQIITTFETQDEYEKGFDVKRIRQYRKYKFNANTGHMKIATTHSFKGWEISTLFLILENGSNLTDELVYTAMTRSIKNLIIINLGNLKYHNFFSNETNYLDF